MVTSAQFAPMEVIQEISTNLAKTESLREIKQIIVTTSYDGRVKVFYQIVALK